MYVSISIFTTTYILNDKPFIPTCADLICCDGAGCNKAYHTTCAGIDDINTLPETWYCPSCTIRSRVTADNVQSQSKMPPSAEQKTGSTGADTTVSSPDVPISIAVKKDTSYDDDTDTDEFESCKSSQSSQAQVDHKASDTKNDEHDGDGDTRYGDKDDKEGGASADNNSDTRQSSDDMNGTATSSTNNQEAGIAASSSSTTATINFIVVEGCGISVVNGKYTKLVGQMFDGAPVYSKRSSSKNYIIYRHSISMGPNNWFISHWNGNISTIGKASLKYYGSPNNADSKTPPTNGWVVIEGYNPVPRCQLVTTLTPPPTTLKKCGKCGKPKKKHSYILAEWDKSDDEKRICLVCTKAKEKWDKNKDYMRYPNT